MTGRKVKSIQIYVPDGAREAIHQHARSRGYTVLTDYIRALIVADMAAHGIEIDLSVDRGGDRRAKADTTEDT